jgi:hypothetical protein
MGNIIKFEFNGVQVSFEGKEKISLTDLWKAAGSPDNKQPAQWIRWPQTKEFIDTLARKLNVSPTHNDIIQTKRGGKNSGTWSHWQIALTYAQTLSPELHMFVNQCFKERVEEENNPDLALDRGYDRAVRGYKKHGKDDKWIENRLYSKIATRENNKVLAKHGGDNRVYRMCANALNVPIIGMTSQEYKESNKLPKSASIRDHFTSIQLLEIALASEVSKQRIKEEGIYGNQNCANVHSVIGGRVHNAVTMRGI